SNNPHRFMVDTSQKGPKGRKGLSRLDLDDAETDVLWRACHSGPVVGGSRGAAAHRLAHALSRLHPLRRIAAPVQRPIGALALELADLAQQRRASLQFLELVL